MFQVERKGALRLTGRGSLAVALRSATSNVAASQFGAAALTDISHQTIVRCQCDAAAALRGRFCSYHENMLYQCRSFRGCGMSMSVHSFRGDATNSACWQQSKVMALELESAFFALLDVETHFDQLERMSMWADIQVVRHSTAGGTYALTRKTLNSSGCPQWRRSASADESDLQHVRLRLYTSDGGPDQQRYKKMMKVDLQNRHTAGINTNKRRVRRSRGPAKKNNHARAHARAHTHTRTHTHAHAHTHTHAQAS
eukprot:4813364-Pyramimonas_sp.AAC.1